MGFISFVYLFPDAFKQGKLDHFYMVVWFFNQNFKHINLQITYTFRKENDADLFFKQLVKYLVLFNKNKILEKHQKHLRIQNYEEEKNAITLTFRFLSFLAQY